MRKVYDMCVKVSEYQDNYNKTRARWRNVSSIMEDDKGGRFILLDKFFNFAQIDTQGRENILISLFEPKSDNNSGSGQGNSCAQQRSSFNNNQPMPSEMQGNWQRSSFDDFNNFNNSGSDSNVPF